MSDLERSFLRHFDRILDHLTTEHPREGCGLMVKQGRRVVWRPCRNVADLHQGKDRFEIHPADLAAAEDAGVIVAVVHSHPDEDCHASDTDRVGSHRSGVPWFIVAVPGGAWSRIDPERLPLVGRRFEHGTVDCYTLVRDYYAWDHGIELPDFGRTDCWWKPEDGRAPLNLYAENFAACGFLDLGQVEPRPGDALLMTIGARVENHAAVYLGDAGDGRGPLILHHLYGRLSGHDVWGGDWVARTTRVLRHHSLMDEPA